VLQPLTITDAELDSLASGGGSRAAVQTLMAGQFSRRVVQVLAIMESAPSVAPGAVSTLDAAFTLLCRVQEASPDAVQAILALPCAGYWADACLRGATGSAGHRYLACLAAAAAARAGYAAEVEVPVLSGQICIPATVTAAGPAASTVTIGVSASGEVAIPGSTAPTAGPAQGAAAPGWRPASVLTARAREQRLSLWLADRGPYRAPLAIRLAAPLAAGHMAEWQRMLTRAWQIVMSRHPEQGAGMALALSTLTPMAGRASGPGGGQDSVTAMAAPGAVLLTQPRDGEAMALTLLHEFQHTKLAALEHLAAMHSGDLRARYYAPWRDDPRPLGALLHGAYAHLGVAAYWRGVLTSADPARHGVAEDELAYWTEAVQIAIAQLQDSAELTIAGRRLVTGMGAAASRLAGLPVAAAARRRAAERLADHQATWRARNQRETMSGTRTSGSVGMPGRPY
jgi:HEXXH motif-containing protein